MPIPVRLRTSNPPSACASTASAIRRSESHSAAPSETRARYLTLVRENHPDRLAARGVPDEFMFIATERMKAINNAYSQIAGKTAA